MLNWLWKAMVLYRDRLGVWGNAAGWVLLLTVLTVPLRRIWLMLFNSQTLAGLRASLADPVAALLTVPLLPGYAALDQASIFKLMVISLCFTLFAMAGVMLIRMVTDFSKLSVRLVSCIGMTILAVQAIILAGYPLFLLIHYLIYMGVEPLHLQNPGLPTVLKYGLSKGLSLKRLMGIALLSANVCFWVSVLLRPLPRMPLKNS